MAHAKMALKALLALVMKVSKEHFAIWVGFLESFYLLDGSELIKPSQIDPDRWLYTWFVIAEDSLFLNVIFFKHNLS